ncbi:MAG: L-glutamine--2-deoxy-scyllo-inosose aminotransferase KanB, partial [Bacteroidota bacterium]
EIAKNVHKALTDEGIDACFYWYDNNWHYHRKWEHLKDLESLGRFPKEVYDQLPTYAEGNFVQSDYWVGRNISALIKLSWSVEEVRQRAKTMVRIVQEMI